MRHDNALAPVHHDGRVVDAMVAWYRLEHPGHQNEVEARGEPGEMRDERTIERLGDRPQVIRQLAEGVDDHPGTGAGRLLRKTRDVLQVGALVRGRGKLSDGDLHSRSKPR